VAVGLYHTAGPRSVGVGMISTTAGAGRSRLTTATNPIDSESHNMPVSLLMGPTHILGKSLVARIGD
jgi:hypothetical protein